MAAAVTTLQLAATVGLHATATTGPASYQVTRDRPWLPPLSRVAPFSHDTAFPPLHAITIGSAMAATSKWLSSSSVSPTPKLSPQSLLQLLPAAPQKSPAESAAPFMPPLPLQATAARRRSKPPPSHSPAPPQAACLLPSHPLVHSRRLSKSSALLLPSHRSHRKPPQPLHLVPCFRPCCHGRPPSPSTMVGHHLPSCCPCPPSNMPCSPPIARRRPPPQPPASSAQPTIHVQHPLSSSLPLTPPQSTIAASCHFLITGHAPKPLPKHNRPSPSKPPACCLFPSPFFLPVTISSSSSSP